ncbi:MAG TPA: polyamine aminopropyltransferase [Bacillota bacterium]|nr:polyamine aminopropyltransferase [Bacillota bacterium]
MELWFSEYHSPDIKISIRVRKQLFSQYSDYQHIQVFDTYEFGRMLVMDNVIMMSEKDEFIYHEMIVHVPMAVHPHARRALIIGGGDGGALRELCRYDDLEEIVMVEIDRLAVEVSKKYLPTVAASFDDPRVTLLFEDGLRYVRRCRDMFDVIIVDSTDPFGPGESLFTKEFYGNCSHALRDGGILVNQHEGPFFHNESTEAAATFKKTSQIFRHVMVYQAHIPVYPAGHWLFGFMSDSYHPLNDFNPERWLARGIRTNYYNTSLHRGAFALPTYVLRLLHEGVLLDRVYKRVVEGGIWPPDDQLAGAQAHDMDEIDFSEIERYGEDDA